MNHDLAFDYYLASGVLVAMMMLGGGYMALAIVGRQKRIEHRLAMVTRQHETVKVELEQFNPSTLAMQIVARFGRALADSGLLPARTLAELQMSLNNANLRGSSGLGLFVGFKVILLFAMALMGFAASKHFREGSMMQIALPLGCAMLGMLAPDWYLKRMRRRHLKKVEAGLPDALDMMVICTEAGLGFEPAIERVSVEIGHAHPAIAEELRITSSELRIIADRRQVLQNMGSRTDLENLRRLASTLIQTTQFGTPLTFALRTLATEMRQETLTRFEARAARLPVLLTVPMIVFILPCIFIIVGGPAVLHITDVLGKH